MTETKHREKASETALERSGHGETGTSQSGGQRAEKGDWINVLDLFQFD